MLWWSVVTVLVGLWSLRSMVRFFQARSFHFMTRWFHSFSVKLDVKAKCSIFFFSINYVFYLFIYFIIIIIFCFFASWLKERGIHSGNTKLLRLLKLVLTVLWNDLTILLVERTDHSRTNKSRDTYWSINWYLLSSTYLKLPNATYS